MKILQVCHTFKPLWESGGMARVAYEISGGLVERGHDVTVYTTNRSLYSTNIGTNKAIYLEGMKVYYFENLRRYFHFLGKIPPPVPYYLPIVVRKEIKNFDIIHIHGHRTLLEVIVHHYARKYGIPYVLQPHGSLPRMIEKQKLKKLYDWIWGNKILKDASKVIALTKTEVEQYKKMDVNEDKIEIISNGIDLSQYDNLPGKGEFRRKYSIRDDEKMVLYLGRIHKIKGIGLLVEAFADLVKELDNVKLVIVGPDDGFLPILKRQIRDLKNSDRVLFTGPLYGRDKLKAYVDADVFVTPSFSGFPVTFLEACACSLPIVTTNNGDKLDWIHNKVGYVVEYDKDRLQDAIFKVLSNEKLRRRIGEEGKRLVREDFSWDEMVGRLEQIYEGIVL